MRGTRDPAVMVQVQARLPDVRSRVRVFFPFSRDLWLAFDLVFRPTEPERVTHHAARRSPISSRAPRILCNFMVYH